MFGPEGFVCNAGLGFLGQGPPSIHGEAGPNAPWMCIPIHPTTANPHNREPLKPEGGLLPWSNCYFHTAQRNAFLVDKIHGDTPYVAHLPQEEVKRAAIISAPDAALAVRTANENYRQYQMEKLERENPPAARENLSAGGRDDTPESEIASGSSTGQSNGDMVSQSGVSAASFEGSSIYDSEASHEGSLASEASETAADVLMSLQAIRNISPTIDIWYDLTIVDEILDSSDLFGELGRLRA